MSPACGAQILPVCPLSVNGNARGFNQVKHLNPRTVPKKCCQARTLGVCSRTPGMPLSGLLIHNTRCAPRQRQALWLSPKLRQRSPWWKAVDPGSMSYQVTLSGKRADNESGQKPASDRRATVKSNSAWCVKALLSRLCERAR